MSSRHSAGQRRLPELLAKGAAADPVIVAERSRMGRSLHQVPALNYPAKLLRPLSPNASA
ncbi:hypothetical protein [Hymenobacter roseosalivarius]|nr:hypothetical protein [Hymenobacter roseosalivarius]